MQFIHTGLWFNFFILILKSFGYLEYHFQSYLMPFPTLLPDCFVHYYLNHNFTSSLLYFSPPSPDFINYELRLVNQISFSHI